MNNNQQLLELIKIIGDETRFEILSVLQKGTLTIGELEQKIGRSRSTTFKQIKILKNAGIISSKKSGTRKYIMVRNKQIYSLFENLESFISTQESLFSKKTKNQENILLMGLDKSGKTSILLSFLGKKNLLAFINQNLKPTEGKQHMSSILYDLNMEFKYRPEVIYHEFGGQVVYRDLFTNKPDEVLENIDKIIYVLDIQDTDRYEESLSYFEIILKNIHVDKLKIELNLFLHKYDPGLDKEKYSNDFLNQQILNKVLDLVPIDQGISIFKTSIFTIFQKNLILQKNPPLY
ncbi:hypothetical protein NEF87_000796 [Candidatus Lokiarchaeum ossiferum]|uniref:HTH arsR-type domain-containing protein n=1 Tax=Candidatus Lokiarchaeum ossiferum TaxID=2951803 RepID=A0ABY6HM70_9ARCH|nr:hypothetical protein NEF87_000796 [Candidatus Lokiarchaeum sp. B-35]